ncbi:protein ABIL2 [Sesamum alatum]|uniref:Protein ABIL2 n=1 Tax=Sesamum alatum TaxID=300844 RepID=A0AAE1Y4B9_9LAMI|nr:protein ABIL2 [Sesamum alatum]
MGSYTPASFSTTPSQKASNYDEIFMQHSLHFADSLKDLKNLRKQLYSAAEYFESSYGKNDHKQLVIDSSKDYVAKALVSTVDHLGSVADKLNRFLDEKASEFSATKIRFSCIEQRLKMSHGLIDLRGITQHSLMLEAPKHHKRYIVPGAETFQFVNSKLTYGNCISCLNNDMYQNKKDNPFAKAFQPARVKSTPPLSRKGQSRISSSESSPNSPNFSFTRVTSNKEARKRSVSPLRFPLMRSGSVAHRSVSPSPSDNKQRSPSEPRRALSVFTKPEMSNREREIQSYTKRSNHLFKALLSVHRSRKDIERSR